jgi:hypothetical protein
MCFRQAHTGGRESIVPFGRSLLASKENDGRERQGGERWWRASVVEGKDAVRICIEVDLSEFAESM